MSILPEVSGKLIDTSVAWHLFTVDHFSCNLSGAKNLRKTLPSSYSLKCCETWSFQGQLHWSIFQFMQFKSQINYKMYMQNNVLFLCRPAIDGTD